MEARFFVTAQDVYYYHLFGYRRLLRPFRLWVLFILASYLLMGLFLFLPFSPFHAFASTPFLVLLPVMALLGLVVNIASYKLRLSWTVSGMRSLQGEHRLLLNPAGIIYRSWRGEHFTPWQHVKSIEQDTYNLYFVLKITGPLAPEYQFTRRMPLFLDRVCIVPKRSFGNPLNTGAFVDAAIALRGNAALVQPENGFGARGA